MRRLALGWLLGWYGWDSAGDAASALGVDPGSVADVLWGYWWADHRVRWSDVLVSIGW